MSLWNTLRWGADLGMLLRPTLLLPVWALLFWGYALATPGPWVRIFFPSPFWLGLVSYSLLLGGAYILNQIVDRDTDRINRKLFLLADGIIPLSWAWGMFWGTTLLSFVLGWFLPVHYRLLWGISWGMGMLYSLPPFRLKARPFWDLVSNALGYGLINVLVGWSLARPLSLESVFEALPFVFAVGAVFLNTTLPDIPGDRDAGLTTTGVFLGPRKTAWLGFLWMWLAVLTAAWRGNLLVMGAAGLSLGPFAAAGFDLRFDRISYRVAGGIFGLVTGLRFPLYLGMGLITLVLLRIYYQRRFGLAYPSLAGR